MPRADGRPDDAQDEFRERAEVVSPRLGAVEWLRWAWRQLTSMRTALLLLLALAVAAVPGSVIPQESADPNGVVLFKQDNPQWVPLVQALQGFDVYSSVWFTAIYLLLFVSLVGCVVPRLRHHWRSLRARPPRTPSRFDRLPARSAATLPGSAEAVLAAAEGVLRRRGYRVQRYGASVSAERGYLRETGNLLFHAALVGVLVAVFVGGGYTWTAQKVVVTGHTMLNDQSSYDTINAGRFVDLDSMKPYSLTLDDLAVRYDQSLNAFGQPLDYTATVTIREPGQAARRGTIKVNDPLQIGGTAVYLLGNGYAAHFVVKDASGRSELDDTIPFRSVGENLMSLGVVKVRFSKPQLGLEGFLYPTVGTAANGEKYSFYPGLGLKGFGAPLVTLNVYEGNLSSSDANVYVLDTSKMTQIAGAQAKSGLKALSLRVGQTVALPQGLGTVELAGITRYAALDVHHDPAQGWVAVFVGLAVAGLIASLLVPRRRMWVRVRDEDGGDVEVEYAALARGDDPGLARALADLERAHRAALPPAVRTPEPAGV